MRKFVLFLALGASGFGAAAQAQDTPPAPPARPLPARGPETRAAFIAQADARFEQMDTDHDGSVSRSEMQGYRQALHDRRIADGRGDAMPPPPPPGDAPRDRKGPKHERHGPDGPHGDRTITRQENTDRAAARFDRMDANHDGIVDQAERDAARPMRGPRGGPDAGADGHTPPPPPGEGAGPDAG